MCKLFLYRQRAYSIRTRIKTFCQYLLTEDINGVREHIPLEQGLRRSNDCQLLSFTWGQRAYSIRTRIKTKARLCGEYNLYTVREHIPLEQGLRLYWSKLCQFDNFTVREHIPLEQGLRPQRFYLCF